MYGVFSVVGIGAGDIKSARRVTNQALLVGAVMVFAVTALAALFSEKAILFLQLKGEIGFRKRHDCGSAVPPSSALHCCKLRIATER